MRRITLTLALLALAACGTDPVGSGQGPEDGLEAPSEWVLSEGVETVEGYPITLRLEDGRVGGTAACNSYGGDAVVDDGRFEVDELAITEMGCPEPGVHDSESAYLEALVAVDRYERQADQLVLLGPDVELRFDPVVPEEDAALTGTEWHLSSLLTGTGPDGAASSTMADARLRLDDDGTLAASDGCNELAGRWSLDGDRLRVDEVSTTDMACEGLEQQTTHVAEVLTGLPLVEHDGRRLLLTTDELGLDYRAE